MTMRKIPFVISLCILGLLSGYAFANGEWLNVSLIAIVLLTFVTAKEDKK